MPADPVDPPATDAAGGRGQLLRVHEAAEQLNCSVSTIRRLIAEKKLPAYRLGHGIRIAEADLERVLRPVR